MPIQGPLHVELNGNQGPPLVLIHQNPADSSIWALQRAHFATWFTVVTPDLPGYGFSPPATDPLTMSELAAACWEAVDRAVPAYRYAVLGGVSIGAWVVLHMAAQRPDRTAARVLSGIGYDPEKAFTARRIADWQSRGAAYRRPYLNEGFGRTFRESPLGHYWSDVFDERNARLDIGSLIALMRALSEREPSGLFSHSIPTLVILGEEDYVLPTLPALQNVLGECTIEVVAGAGHNVNVEAPAAWDRAVSGFLRARGVIAAQQGVGAA